MFLWHGIARSEKVEADAQEIVVNPATIACKEAHHCDHISERHQHLESRCLEFVGHKN
jgi:hypothetical protein